MLKKIIYIAFILFTANSYTQLPTLEWARRFPDTNIFNAGANAMVLDNLGNVYVTGYADSSSFLRYCTVKYNTTGARLWTSYFFGSGLGGRYARAIALDSFSNIYVTGYSYNPSSYFDYCTVKYNSDGIQQWIKYYNEPVFAQDDARKIGVDKAGNIYVTGESSLGGLNFQYATVKYSSDGTELWVRRFGTPDGSTFVRGLEIDEQCNIYITGISNDSATTVKYDSSGNVIWSNRYCGNAGNTEANDIAVDANYNVYITGYTTTLPTHTDFFTVKYSTGGAQQWVRRFNTDTTQSNYNAHSVGLDNFGNVYVSGFFRADPTTSLKFCTIKYDVSGDTIWVRNDTSGLVFRTFMEIDKNDNIYLASTNGLSSYLTIKYDSSGVLLWREKYEVVGTAYPSDLKINKNFNLFLTGNSNNKMLTLKYSQSVGIEQISSNTPYEFKLEQNYPNPFNPTTFIKFHVANSSHVKLSVFDVLGREAAILVSEHLKTGVYEASWNAENYPSGVYFAVFTAGRYKFTTKMVLIK